MTTSLIDKIELLIKREKTTPDRKKDDPPKSSSEILSELFGAFNADPPKIDEIPVKKSKKSKKKLKKEKKKRSRSISSSSSDESEYSHKRKKRKKSSKAKKHRSRSRSRRQSKSPPSLSPPYKPGSVSVSVKPETSTKLEDIKVKNEEVKSELKQEPKRRASIKLEEKPECDNHVRNIDASLIPMPESPKDKLDGDLLQKLDSKKSDTETDKAKGKIQIKNLKFSTVFEETVKKAEEEARKRAEKYEEGEYTDSSSDSVKEVVVNSQFPKTSDPGGLKKQAEDKLSEDEKSHKKSKKESSHKSSKRDRDRSKSKRSPSKSHRSRSPRKHRRSSSRARRSGSRTRRRSRSRSRRRDRDRDRDRYPRHHETRHRGERRRSRSPTGVKLADSEKKRLLEVARRNAINMLKNGAVPAGAAALPPHTRNQVMAAIQSGGKSVDELTDFCKHLSKKEALGELSSVSSHDEDMSENEDTLAFHHPFLVKEKAPIIMNIRGGAPLPIKSSAVAVANKEELRLQFPVSSGTQHREKSSEWRPVSPKKDDMQVAKIGSSNSKPSSLVPKAIESGTTSTTTKPAPLALPAPPVPLGPPAPPLPLGTPAPPVPPVPPAPPGLPALPAPLAHPSPNFLKALQTAAQLSLSTSGALAALPAPGPQAYPPGVEPPNIDLAKIVSQKLQMIRKEQEHNELTTTRGFGWSKESSSLGEFHGSGASGAQFLTPRELASGTQAWAKKDQLQRAAPVEGGMGMHLLQKMGWTPGRGLGKEGTGTLQPLLLEVKLDTKGLQAKEEASGRNRGMKLQRGRAGPRGGGGGVTLVAGGKHPVSLLGEYCSKQKMGPPEYNLCFECGPDHKKNFLFKVKVAGTEYQPAVASQNKKQAKSDAAQLALQKIGILP